MVFEYDGKHCRVLVSHIDEHHGQLLLAEIAGEVRIEAVGERERFDVVEKHGVVDRGRG